MSTVFLTIYIIWFLSELALNRMVRATGSDKQDADKNSLRLIWLMIMIVMPLSVYIAMRFSFVISNNPVIAYIGLALTLLGVLLRLLIIKTLGKFFTVDVTIRQDHALKKDGFYSFLRHPSYFASLLSFIGFGLSLNNWVSLGLIATCMLIVFINRIRIEERVLIAYFGDEYISYRKKTKAIIPFIY